MDTGTYTLYCLILDLGYPMDEQTLQSILTGLENVLTLTWFSKTHNKSNSIAISTINKDAQNLGTVSVRDDFKKIQALIGKVTSLVRLEGKTNWRLTAEEYEDFLQLIITTAMNEYNHKVNSLYGGRRGRLRIAVVSGKPGKTLSRVLCSIRRRWANFKVEGAAAEVAPDIAPIQVINTGSGCGGVNLGWPNEHASDNLDCLDGNVLQPTIIVVRAKTSERIQEELKRFLLVPDPHVVKLVISAEAITSSKIANAVDDSGTVVICEATPLSLDPSDLPTSAAHNFLISPANEDEDKVVSDFGQPENRKAIRCLIIKSRVSSDGVCDGSTFGTPFCLSPLSFGAAATTPGFVVSEPSSKLKIDENIECFWAMHQLLTEREEVLLTTMESDIGVGGNFVIYAGGDCLLLQAIQSVELAVPASIEAFASTRKNISPIMIARIENILDPLPWQEFYKPSEFPTGIIQHLASLTKGNVQKSSLRKRASAKYNSLILSYANNQKEDK